QATAANTSTTATAMTIHAHTGTDTASPRGGWGRPFDAGDPKTDGWYTRWVPGARPSAALASRTGSRRRPSRMWRRGRPLSVDHHGLDLLVAKAVVEGRPRGTPGG